MKPILVLLPSLDRSKSLCECLTHLIGNGTGIFDVLTISGTGGVTQALNSVPMELIANYQVIGLIGDDVRVNTPGWDEMVMAHLRYKIGLVYGRDGFKDQSLCTHPFISSKIIRTLGFVQYPTLRAFYCDDFWMELLKPLDALYYEPNLVTEHLHYSCGKSAKDATYAAAEGHWPHDTAEWERIKREDLPRMRERVKAIL